jgi:hypothetical protein
MGPVILFKDGHSSKIDVSSLFFKILTFRNDESKRKAIKPRNHHRSVVSTKSLKLSIKFKQQQGSRSSRLFPVGKSYHQDLLRRQVHVKISTASFVVTYFCRDLQTLCPT